MFSKVQKTGSTTLTFMLSRFLSVQRGYSVHRFKQGPMQVDTEEGWVRKAWKKYEKV